MSDVVLEARGSAEAIATTRRKCVRHGGEDGDYISKEDAGWQSCLEYWGLEGIADWCPGCLSAVVVAALTPEEADCLIEREWVGEGPSVAEAGGDTILARVHGVLVRTEWRKIGSFGAWYPEGKVLVTPPTGWRRMPKARG